jgi:hypothetical protein
MRNLEMGQTSARSKIIIVLNYVITARDMNTYGGLLDGGEWSASHPCRFTHGHESLIPTGYEAVWVPEPAGTLWRFRNFV